MFVRKGGKLIIFSAPSGSGKTTNNVKHLLNSGQNLIWPLFSIFAIFPDLDVGKEKNGEHYYFMSLSELRNIINEDDFLIWEAGV